MAVDYTLIANSSTDENLTNPILVEHNRTGGVLGAEVTARERSKQIDRYLKAESTKLKHYMRKTMRLLLVGAGESGKSTIVKQMKILHKGGYNESERREFIPIIMDNVQESILALVHAMPSMHPPVELKNPELEPCAEFMRTCASVPEFQVTDEFFDKARSLWQDEGVQACHLRGNEFQLLDSAKYFLDKIQEIRDPDFLPEDQDIVRSRKMTKGVAETWFEVNHVKFHMLDVGGQRDERKKWLQCFSDITALIFVVALSGFDLTLREDDTKNRLVESLLLYERLWKNSIP